jgi:hypothetical protein
LEGIILSWRIAMWTPQDRALFGDFGAEQALSDEQYRLLEPLIPPAKPGGRPQASTTACRSCSPAFCSA